MEAERGKWRGEEPPGRGPMQGPWPWLLVRREPLACPTPTPPPPRLQVEEGLKDNGQARDRWEAGAAAQVRRAGV